MLKVLEEAPQQSDSIENLLKYIAIYSKIEVAKCPSIIATIVPDFVKVSAQELVVLNRRVSLSGLSNEEALQIRKCISTEVKLHERKSMDQSPRLREHKALIKAESRQSQTKVGGLQFSTPKQYEYTPQLKVQHLLQEQATSYPKSEIHVTKLVGEIKPYVWQSFEVVDATLDCFPRFSPDGGCRKLLFDDDFCDGLFDKKFDDHLYLSQDSSFASTNQLR